jgi:hypothetical protein
MLVGDRYTIKILYYNRSIVLLRIIIAIYITITSYTKDYYLLY